MSGNYFDAKRAAVAGVPYYDYLAGPGYDQIPVTEYYGGLGAAFDDARVVNTAKEIRPNVVHDFMESGKATAPQADKH